MADPAVAADAVQATQDTAAFAQALVTAINDAGSVLTLDPSQVTVYEPSVETTMEYEVVVGTADATVMDAVVEKTTWSSADYREAARATLKFQGHLSHGVGMSVHDVGDYRRLPLRPGVVFALDPQMWIPEQELYIRVEDTVAVTGDGVEVLTRGVPLELDEVEEQVGIALGDEV